MMMRIETTFKIAGYPGFAIVFFLAAGLGGLALVLDVLWKDRSVSRAVRKRT